MNWNFVIDIHSHYDGFWAGKRPEAIGIKLGFIGFFVFFVDTVSLAYFWKQRAELVEEERDGFLKDNLELIQLMGEAIDNVNNNVLPKR